MLRKLISLALCMILCVSASVISACAEETAPVEKRITKIQKAVEEDGDKALWELVNTHYSTNTYVEEGCANVYIWAPNGPSLAYQVRDNEPVVNQYTVMMEETAGVGFTVEQIIICTVQPDGTCDLYDATQDLIPKGSCHIETSGSISYIAYKPADGTSRYEIIAVAGTDDNGHELEFYGVMQRLNNQIEDVPDQLPVNTDKDIENLRHDAEFQMILADGVWWVPVSVLGTSRYTNREIAEMVEHSPEQKQEEISTLYEAIQLYKISGYTYTRDNTYVWDGDNRWENHKPGRDSVRTNTGCCAAEANWLNYILNGDYEQMGFLAYCIIDDEGHAFNYIYKDGYYYFVDLTGYVADTKLNALENGYPASYQNSGTLTGNLIKAKSPEVFVKYYVDMKLNAPNLFFLYQAEDMPPTSGTEIEGRQIAIYPEGIDIKVIEGKNPEEMGLQFMAGPKKNYSWTGMKNAKFKVKDKYLRTAEDTATEPLTAWHPGDVLTLEDNSDKGRAVIDGIKFGTSKRDEVQVGFEENLYLDGNGVNGVYNLSMPFEQHSEAIKDMDSLVLGELNIGIFKTIPETQIVICTREGDQLTVQEVMDGKYYESRPISIRKDEEGNWTEAPDYWYLIITKSKKMKYEFGRFKCAISAEGR